MRFSISSARSTAGCKIWNENEWQCILEDHLATVKSNGAADVKGFISGEPVIVTAANVSVTSFTVTQQDHSLYQVCHTGHACSTYRAYYIRHGCNRPIGTEIKR